MPVRERRDPPALLTVAVQFERPRRRAEMRDYLVGQPLLPRWRVRVVEGPADASGSAARVTVVGSTALRAARTPAPGSGTGLVALLDHPSEIAAWPGIGCVLLAAEPLHRLGRAIAEAAEGNVWLSPYVAPYLPKAMVTARVVALPFVSPDRCPQPGVELTPVEEETLAMVVRGLSNAEIAAHRGVKVTTVKTYLRSLLRKFGCQRRQELIAVALRGPAGERGFIPHP